jgi:hypothetical protein
VDDCRRGRRDFDDVVSSGSVLDGWSAVMIVVAFPSIHLRFLSSFCSTLGLPASFPSLVSEGVLAFLRFRIIDIYGVHKNVKFLRHF